MLEVQPSIIQPRPTTWFVIKALKQQLYTDGWRSRRKPDGIREDAAAGANMQQQAGWKWWL